MSYTNDGCGGILGSFGKVVSVKPIGEDTLGHSAGVSFSDGRSGGTCGSYLYDQQGKVMTYYRVHVAWTGDHVNVALAIPPPQKCEMTLGAGWKWVAFPWCEVADVGCEKREGFSCNSFRESSSRMECKERVQSTLTLDTFSHAHAKRPQEHLKLKMYQACNCGVRFSSEAFNLTMRDWRDAAARAGQSVGMRRPLAQCFDLKGRAKSVGEPFDQTFANFGNLIATKSSVTIVTWVKEVLEDVKKGGDGHCPLFRAHVKADKYNEKKRRTGTWRATLGADLVCLFLQQHLFAELAEAAERVHDRIDIHVTAERWNTIVVDRSARHETAGVDDSNYEETESSELLSRIAQSLCHMVGCSELLERYVVRIVAYGWGLDSLGNVVERAGGNPSGQYLTGVLNSLDHEVINFTCWSVMFGIPVEEVLSRVDWCVVGDDELVAPTSAEDMVEFIGVSETNFGIVAKPDFCRGELYPVEAHASFLSRVTALVDGYQVILPSEP